MDEYDHTIIHTPEEEFLLPKLPRSLPFDELVFIIEDRITALIELPYTIQQVHGTPFYLSIIRPIVASLILPYDEDSEYSSQGSSSDARPYSTTASLRGSSQVPKQNSKTYSFTDQHRGIVAALLVARLEFLDSVSDGFGFAQKQDSEEMMFRERGVLEARAYTAELVAIKFLSFMTLETDRIEFLTYEYKIDDDNQPERPASPRHSEVDSGFILRNTISKSTSNLQNIGLHSPSRGIPVQPGNPLLSRSTNNLSAFTQFSQSYDERTRPFMHMVGSPVENRFRSRAPSLSESTPLLGSSPRDMNHYFEPLLQAATNPVPKVLNHSNSTNDRLTSAHDKLIEHGLFIEQYSDQSAMDIALVSPVAREFISSDAVQSVMVGIWSGRIMFWKTIEADAKKCIHIFNGSNTEDIYSRLRVPRYRTMFMMMNYSILMMLFYLLLFQRHQKGSALLLECILNIWFVGFVLDEVSQAREAGSLSQYFADFWSFFDLCIVGFFMMFAGLRIFGKLTDSVYYTDLSFDILSLEAVLLVPRLFSFLAIFPYFGTLLPCLRDLTLEFFKFLVLIIIIYVGFLTTFSFLGRDNFSFHDMAWLLVRVFFGSSFAGFDAAPQISPIFGPPLMLIFVTLTNILLITVLISILSEKFSGIMMNARQEYAIHFSSTVVESINTLDRVTYFYPPFNILGVLMRPLRFFLDHNSYKTLRIKILKITHWFYVAVVWIYENASLGVKMRKEEQYSKLKKDRRMSVAKRILFQRNPNPFLDDETPMQSEDEDEDLEQRGGLYIPTRKRRARKAVQNDAKLTESSKKRLLKRTETFFPKFKRHPKNIKRNFS